MRRRLMAKYESGGGGVLPAEYQQVEYLQSSGTQCINTEYYPDSYTWVECTFKEGGNPSSSGEFSILGVINTSSQGLFSINHGATSYSLLYLWNNLSVSHGGSLATISLAGGGYDSVYTIKMGYRVDYDDNVGELTNDSGTSTTSLAAKTSTSLYPMVVMGTNRGGTLSAYTCDDLYLYGYKIYENGVLVQDAYPCYRISDSEPGMYDIVNDVFYTNAGSGSFVVGGGSNYLIISALCRNQERRAA